MGTRIGGLPVPTIYQKPSLLHPIIADTLPGFEVTSWTGIGAPKGCPRKLLFGSIEKSAALADRLMKGASRNWAVLYFQLHLPILERS